jgi:hypothetical protein
MARKASHGENIMAKQSSNPRVLTTAEIDDFANRLKATVQLATQHQAIMSRLTELLGRPAAQAVAAQAGLGGLGGTGGRRGGRRPTLDDQAVLDMIRRSPEGTAAGDIQREFGASPFQVKGVIQRLRGGKQIRVTGQKRGTRYFPADGGGESAGGGGGGKKAGKAAKKGGKAAKNQGGQTEQPAS